MDVLCYFFIILLVDEDKHIMFGIGGIIEHPVLTWMISLIFITADGYVGRGSKMLKEGGGWSLL
jgi:hypothetical protein